ncbi:MAG: M48 family metalloprotease [Acaryochloridaceae cyanobacterium CSU_3_4]|nr:M48 family metalloprotease [Acaryochloris sp. SU_5_25]NJN39277.1 M48 family metalloprotease [Acaryochloridaceae cyanobacterium CSU_3_4]
MFPFNQLKTAALLGLLSGLIVLTSYSLVGNEQGLYIGLALSAMTTLGSSFYSDKVALAAYQAQPLERIDAPKLYDTVARLRDRANLPMPALFIVPTKSPNAFATGRDPQHAAVAMTEGIIELLSTKELEGVLAQTVGRQIPINGNPALSSLLIINPLSREGLQNLFRTHPSTEERIQRLQELAKQPKQRLAKA